MDRIDRRALLRGAAMLGAAALVPGRALANDGSLRGWGVVLIHGKAGNMRHLSRLEGLLRGAGPLTSAPSMSWNASYRTYDETLGEVGREVSGLKARGAARIALAGQSLGSNVALGYAATVGGVAAVIAMAPGHRPEFIATRTGDSLARARAMAAQGRGGETARFSDFNQGETYDISTTAAAYLSFFEANGPANMSRSAGRIKGARLLWVIGTMDRPAQQVPRGGTTIMVEAGHGRTAEVGAEQAVAWLKGV